RDDTRTMRNDNVDRINELIEILNKQQTASVDNAKTSIHSIVFILIVATVSAILLGMLIMVLISRRITSHLKQIIGITTEISKGNLEAEDMAYTGKDEIGQLAHAVNQMKANLRNIVANVANMSETVASRSGELMQSSTEVKE